MIGIVVDERRSTAAHGRVVREHGAEGRGLLQPADGREQAGVELDIGAFEGEKSAVRVAHRGREDGIVDEDAHIRPRRRLSVGPIGMQRVVAARRHLLGREDEGEHELLVVERTGDLERIDGDLLPSGTIAGPHPGIEEVAAADEQLPGAGNIGAGNLAERRPVHDELDADLAGLGQRGTVGGDRGQGIGACPRAGEQGACKRDRERLTARA